MAQNNTHLLFYSFSGLGIQPQLGWVFCHKVSQGSHQEDIKLTAGGHSQSFPHGPFQHGQKGKESLRKTNIIILCNGTIEAISHHFCYIILVRNKSQVLWWLETNHRSHLYSRGGDYTRAWKTGVGNPKGHLGVCLPHKYTVLRELTRKAM